VQDDEIEGLNGFVRYEHPFFICKNDQMEFEARPMCEPVVWDIEGRNYYSIPKMQICLKENGNFVLGEGWFDHDRFERIWDLISGGNWSWVAIKLYNGINIMGYRRKKEIYTEVEHNGKIYKEEIKQSYPYPFELDSFYLKNLPIPLRVYPLIRERIFRPKIGMKYSEQPLMICCDGKEVGYGIREKTYGGQRVDESRLTISPSLEN
jgi:hypothetical protein